MNLLLYFHKNGRKVKECCMFIKKTNDLNLNPKDLKNLDSESFKLKQNDDESIFLKKKTTGDTANQQYIILNPKPKKTIINTPTP